MAKRQVTGTCHICGVEGKLSFEHVPPKSAFNDQRVVTVGYETAINLGPYERPSGKILQRGAGAYTLCAPCNNKTGRWYAKDFATWCVQAADVLIKTDFNPKIFTLHYIYPLRVLKQIVTMFFSVYDKDAFRKAHPELVEFVLSPKRMYLPPKFRFFVYFNRGDETDRFRYLGISSQLGLSFDTRPTVMSEIAFPPLGYLLTVDSAPPDRRLTEITHFSRYAYDDFKVVELNPPVLPTVMPFPGDYRTAEEVAEQAARSEAEAVAKGWHPPTKQEP